MKRILSLAIVALLMFCSHSFAANTPNPQVTATIGDQNSSSIYRVTAYSDSANSPVVGYVTFAQDTGIVYPYLAYTASNTFDQLVTGESGSIIVDYGGATVNTSAPATKGPGGSLHQLPPCTSTQFGQTYTIAAGSRVTITLDPYGTDVLLNSISGTGFSAGNKAVSLGEAGDSMSVECVGTGVWAVKSQRAAWTNGG